MLLLKLSAMNKATRQAAANANVLSLPLQKRRESYVECAQLRQAMPRVYYFSPKEATAHDSEVLQSLCRTRYEQLQPWLPHNYADFFQRRDMPRKFEPVRLNETTTGYDYNLTGLFRLTWQWPQSLANVRAFEAVLASHFSGMEAIPLHAIAAEPNVSNVSLHSLWDPDSQC